MKKLLILALIGFAAWQAKLHYHELFHPLPSHEAVVVNSSGTGIERLRVKIGDQTFVKDKLAAGDRAVFPFRVSRDASFGVTWQWADRNDEKSWTGGMVPRGPMVQRHIITIEDGGDVI